KIRYFPAIDKFELYHSNYLENYFWVLLVPREWGFELMEAWKPGASWNADSKEPTFMTDHEFYAGRKNYAENTAGGYYATRMAIAEHLLAARRQCTAIVFREIGDAGTPSLGVWKVRETVRDAMKKRPLDFDSLDLALKYVESRATIPINYWYSNSVLLQDLKKQRRLSDFV
ncbi:MAG: hypothetical protein NUV67_05565, partial [archaeon]|nr:hypothetical protein [archaeon]